MRRATFHKGNALQPIKGVRFMSFGGVHLVSILKIWMHFTSLIMSVWKGEKL